MKIYARRRPVSAVTDYVLALLLVVAATAILNVARQLLNTPVVALLYLLPVGLSAAFWGLWPGIMAALAAFLTFN
jgi:K+-sensing histidine kinase KdpD